MSLISDYLTILEGYYTDLMTETIDQCSTIEDMQNMYRDWRNAIPEGVTISSKRGREFLFIFLSRIRQRHDNDVQLLKQ